jgi:acyl-CoA synthetase (AMP-forming)/AMP-acid ligase II
MAIRESGPKSYRFRDDIGHRLLPHVVDELAQTDPDRVLYEFPSSNDRLSDTFVHVTARQYANAINRTAWWLETALGRRPSSPTVGYEGPQDLRYYLLVIAAVKTGYKMLFTSPRNTVEGDLAVIRGAKCGIWLLPNHGSLAGRLLEHVSLETLTLPDLDFFLDPATVPHFEYLKDWEAGRRDYAWVLHTSGSTGNPKPVFRFLDSVASAGANNLLPHINGKPLLLHDYYDTRAYLTFPFYHGAGLVNGMLWPIYHGTTIVLGPQRPVSLDLMKQVIRRTEPTSVFTAPSLVEEISKDAEFLELLRGVEALAYGGGPVSFEAGDRIWKHTKLRLSIGTTEAGWLPCVETDPEDWNYIHPHPNCGFQFRPHADGLYELIAVRQSHLAQWQSIFSTFPDLDEYNTRDLFSRHATKEGLYKYEGRADNIIVLSNGEKVQPNNMELIIGAHPLIKAAIIAGQGRFQTSAIVEVLETSYPRHAGERRALIEQILPSIDAANKLAPTHGKLDPDLIVFGHPAKPFQRTPKSTIRRGPTIQLYADELDQAYAQAELAGDSEAKVRHPVNLQSQETLEESLRELILAVADLKTLDKNDDLFADTGVDSLQVMTIRRRLVQGLPRDSIIQAGAITGALIYKNPTVCQLAAAILNLARNGDIKSSESAESRRLADDLLLKYTKDLPPRLDRSRDKTPNSDYHIVLTGSTGSLGSYILDHLIQAESVKEVWCLNRSTDAESRQARLNAKRGLRSDFAASNVRFLQAKLSEERLGLQETDYNDISERVTHIIGKSSRLHAPCLYRAT